MSDVERPSGLNLSPRAVAHWTRRYIGLGEPSVDLDKLLTTLNLGLREVDSCPRSSRLAVSETGLEVQVRRAAPPIQRFWIAHEVGHFLVATKFEIPFRDQVTDSRYESFCNSFASHLLLPGSWLRQEVADHDASLVTALTVASHAQTSILATVAALNQRAGWDSVLVMWKIDRTGRWRASSVIGQANCGLIGSTDDTTAHLDNLDARAQRLELPLEVGGTRRQVHGEAIRWRDHCFSLFQRSALAS